MNPSKIRNKQIYRATNQFRGKQAGSHLSKQLRQKYGQRCVRIINGDTVKVIRGEFKGVDGKVVKVSTAKHTIAIEGIKKQKRKGDKIDVYIDSSNVVITNLNTDDKWRTVRLEKKPKEKIKLKILIFQKLLQFYLNLFCLQKFLQFQQILLFYNLLQL